MTLGNWNRILACVSEPNWRVCKKSRGSVYRFMSGRHDRLHGRVTSSSIRLPPDRLWERALLHTHRRTAQLRLRILRFRHMKAVV